MLLKNAHRVALCLLLVLALMITQIDTAKAAGTNLAGICDAPIREFQSGHGRRTGNTIVFVAMRQDVFDEMTNRFVAADDENNLALNRGDEVDFKLLVRNTSEYDVANVLIRHVYKRGTDGPKSDGIGRIDGALYDPRTDMFEIPYIRKDSTVTVTYTLLLRDRVGDDISQFQVVMEDYNVLEQNRRFPQRTPESRPSSNRTNVEKLGIGGMENSCFTASRAVISRASAPPLLSRSALARGVRAPVIGPGDIASIIPPERDEDDVPPENAHTIDDTSSAPRFLPPAPLLEQPTSPVVRRNDRTVGPQEVVLPVTGWERSGSVWLFVQVLIGVALGVAMFGGMLRVVWRRISF